MRGDLLTTNSILRGMHLGYLILRGRGVQIVLLPQIGESSGAYYAASWHDVRRLACK